MSTRAVVVQMEVYTPQEVEEAVRAGMDDASEKGMVLLQTRDCITSLIMARLRGERP